jgi:hypothetical protein
MRITGIVNENVNLEKASGKVNLFRNGFFYHEHQTAKCAPVNLESAD